MNRLLIALVLFPVLGFAQIGGQTTFQFLNNIASARVAGQGSNAIANTAPDLNFALYNPALLNEQVHGQLSTSIVDYVSDIRYADVAYAHHQDSVGTFFAQIMYFDYGTFDRANVIGIRQGTFTGNDLAVNLGYAYSIDSNWSVGATMKVINSVYDTWSSWGLAWDAGLLYQIPSRRIAMSLVMRNAGFQLNPYADERENLPFELQFGFSNRFEHMPLRWQITLEHLETLDLRYRDPTAFTVNQFDGSVNENFPSIWNNLLRHVVIGAEFAPSESFNIQFGYNFRRREELNLDTRRTVAGFSVGGGIKIYKFYFHYSRNMYHIAGGANQITLRTSLDQFKK
ncbi:MAG: type IX secretion system protein PorQ [Croceimicrobium sp.]